MLTTLLLLTAPQSAEPTREIFMHLPGWAQGVFYVTSGLACLIFAWGFWRRIKKYRRGRSENRFDNLGGRVYRAIVTILTNSTVRKGETLGGLAHTMILWGFLILFIGTCIVAIDHDFLRFFDVQILKGSFYLWFSLCLDLFGLLFLAGLVLMIVRRFVLKPEALDYARADDHDAEIEFNGLEPSCLVRLVGHFSELIYGI